MITRRLLFTVIVSLLIIALSSPSQAFFNRDVKKAKEFMAAGMYPQAIELLNKRINDKPTDAEAHFQLGICYVITGNHGAANQRFGSAVRLKPDYGYKIGPEYHKTGSAALDKGGVSEALTLFTKAVQYQPDLKADIGQECFTAGQSYLNRGEVGQANTLFIKSVEYNPGLKEGVAQECFEAGKSYLGLKQSSIADDLLSIALTYDASLTDDRDRITKEYGKRLLAIAKEKPKKERKRYVDEAKKYLLQKDIDEVLPPPTWESVFTKTYIGKGMGENGLIKINLKGILGRGDRICVTGKEFERYYFGQWKRYKDKQIFEQKNNPSGDPLGFKAPKGEKVAVEVQRSTSSY